MRKELRVARCATLRALSRAVEQLRERQLWWNAIFIVGHAKLTLFAERLPALAGVDLALPSTIKNSALCERRWRNQLWAEVRDRRGDVGVIGRLQLLLAGDMPVVCIPRLRHVTLKKLSDLLLPVGLHLGNHEPGRLTQRLHSKASLELE